jgi:MFS family permease
VVIGAEAVTAMLARPFAGIAYARFGPRRVFVAGALLVAAGSLPNVIASTLVSLVLLRLLVGVGVGAVLATSHVWVVELAGSRRSARALGWIGTVGFLTVAVGPPLASALRALGGFSLAWIVVAACAVTGALVVVATPEPERGEATARPRIVRGIRLALRPGLGVASAFSGYATTVSFAALALDGRGVAGGGLVLTVCAVTIIAARLLLGGAVDRFRAAPVAYACAASQAAGLLLLAITDELAPALVAAALIGLGLANVYAALARHLLGRTPARERTVALASLGAFVDLGIAAGAPLAGVLVALAGYGWAFAAMAVLVVLAVSAVFVDPRGGRAVLPTRHAAAAPHADLAAQERYDAAKSSTRAVWPGAVASRASQVISGAPSVSASAMNVAS